MGKPSVKFKEWQIGRSDKNTDSKNDNPTSFITSTEKECHFTASVVYNGNQGDSVSPIDPKTIKWTITGQEPSSLKLQPPETNWSGSHPSPHETPAEVSKPPVEVSAPTAPEKLAGLEFIEIPDIPPDPLSETDIRALYAGLPPSAVPENLPEHLKLPEAFKKFPYAIYRDDPNVPSLTEVRAFMQQVIDYAIANHNPKRPIAEVWPAFMEAERIYNTLAAQHLGKFPGGTGGGNIEWGYEQFWAFPEVHELWQDGEHYNSLPTLVYDVELGLEDPNWNVTTLPDGRTFRMRRNHSYEFKYPGGGYRISYTRPENTVKNVVIDDVFEISDAELESLSGWNYNFNPYTGGPITLYCEPTYVETQSGFLVE